MKETNNKLILSATLNNVSRNLAVAIGVGLGLKYTRNPLCLLGLLFVTGQQTARFRFKDNKENKDERNEE